jgi:hypothetical protein
MWAASWDELAKELQKALDHNAAMANAATVLIKRHKDIISEAQARELSLKASMDTMLTEIEGKTHHHHWQDTDSNIQSAFYDLQMEVRSFATDFTEQRLPTEAHFLPRHLPALRQIIPNLNVDIDLSMLLRDRRQRRQVVQSLLAFELFDQVFRRRDTSKPNRGVFGLDPWLRRSIGKNVAKIEAALAPSHDCCCLEVTNILPCQQPERQEPPRVTHKDLHKWRSLTLNLLNEADKNSGDGEALSNDMGRLELETALLQVLEPISSTLSTQKLRGALKSLTENVIRFSKLLRRQQACWSLSYPTGPISGGVDSENTGEQSTQENFLLFDNRTMEDEDDQGKVLDSAGTNLCGGNAIVRMVLFPALWKRGNAAGDHYDVQSCCGRAQVRCKRIVLN